MPAFSQPLPTALVTGTPAPAAAGTAVPLVATSNPASLAHEVMIWPGRTGRTANTGTVYLGLSGAGTTQNIPLATGSSPIKFTAPPGKVIDLSLIFVNSVTTGDGVIFHAICPQFE